MWKARGNDQHVQLFLGVQLQFGRLLLKGMAEIPARPMPAAPSLQSQTVHLQS